MVGVQPGEASVDGNGCLGITTGLGQIGDVVIGLGQPRIDLQGALKRLFGLFRLSGRLLSLALKQPERCVARMFDQELSRKIEGILGVAAGQITPPQTNTRFG
ncbi:hypothetical protein FQZ97_875880 [compost metagenome]